MQGDANVIIPKSSLLGLPISHAQSKTVTLALLRERLQREEACIVSFINPLAFHLRLADQAYANALWHFDAILPDGIGVAIAARWINNVDVERQSFDETSLFAPVMGLLDDLGKSLCLVGSQPGVAERAQAKMRKAYGNIDFCGVFDGFQPFEEMVEWIMQRKPNAVLVGMGAPLQESFLLRLRQRGYRGLGLTCGGFLDQYTESQRYYPHLIDRLELRWLYRLMKEPRRLGQRYLVHYQTFVHDVLSIISSRAIGHDHQKNHLWLAKRYARNEA